MKTNLIKGNLDLYERIEQLEKENNQLKEKNKDCKKFLEVLEQWFQDTEDHNINKDIDCGVYEL